MNNFSLKKIFKFKTKKDNIIALALILIFWQILLIFLVSKNLQLQIFNLLILAGLYFCWEDKIESHNPIKINKNTFIFSLVIILSVLIRGIYSVSDQDIFPYLTIPLLNISLIILYDGLKSFNKNLGIIFISFLVPMRFIFMNITERFLVPFTSNLTWLNLQILGINSNITNNIIYFEKKGIRIADGCTGADQIFFGISTFIIFCTLFPLVSKLYNLIMILISIVTPFIENTLRLSLLAIINSLDYENSGRLFTFFHTSYGSIIFTSFTIIVLSKSYFEFFKNENKFN